MKTRPARISLSAYDAEHLYAILLDHWHNADERFGGCYECQRTGRRFERLIGPAAARSIRRQVAKNLTGANRHKKPAKN
jgi:hypothetical protein